MSDNTAYVLSFLSWHSKIINVPFMLWHHTYFNYKNAQPTKYSYTSIQKCSVLKMSISEQNKTSSNENLNFVYQISCNSAFIWSWRWFDILIGIAWFGLPDTWIILDLQIKAKKWNWNVVVIVDIVASLRTKWNSSGKTFIIWMWCYVAK